MNLLCQSRDFFIQRQRTMTQSLDDKNGFKAESSNVSYTIVSMTVDEENSPSDIEYVFPPPKEHKIRKTQTEVQLFPCGICGEKLADRQGLAGHHQRKHVRIPRFKCDQCPYESVMKRDLKVHLNKHIRDEFKQKFSCTICGIVKKKKVQLAYHMKTAHNDDGELVSSRKLICSA
jgi:hypothetical protein